MVDERDRAALDARLIVWRGPLPFTLIDDPPGSQSGSPDSASAPSSIDSLKDMAVGLAEDAVGAAVNMALQEAVACGIEVVDLHHQRKGQDGRKPRTLEDVYGSTWLTAGHGSVVLLWGEAGDPYVELAHLKQPAGEVGPLDVQHDHDRGRSDAPRRGRPARPRRQGRHRPRRRTGDLRHSAPDPQPARTRPSAAREARRRRPDQPQEPASRANRSRTGLAA